MLSSREFSRRYKAAINERAREVEDELEDLRGELDCQRSKGAPQSVLDDIAEQIEELESEGEACSVDDAYATYGDECYHYQRENPDD